MHLEYFPEATCSSYILRDGDGPACETMYEAQ